MSGEPQPRVHIAVYDIETEELLFSFESRFPPAVGDTFYWTGIGTVKVAKRDWTYPMVASQSWHEGAGPSLQLIVSKTVGPFRT